MKEQTDIVVVMPVGPRCRMQYVSDTIRSLNVHAPERYPVILIDDSQMGTGKALQDIFPDQVVVLPVQKNRGKAGGLYSSLCEAFCYALDHYHFRLVLRMDTDALVIGQDPAAEALAYFDLHPETGMAGSYISRRFAPDGFGNMQDNAYPRNTLLVGTCTWKFIRRPRVNWTLRKLMFRAFLNGYELGENIQGGAYFISCNCLMLLRQEGLLPLRILSRSILMEDHLFSLLTRAAGMQLGDLGGSDGPFGCVWKGLPAAPESLLQSGKKIIHSVRSWKNLDEQEIRLYFKHQRSIQSRL